MKRINTEVSKRPNTAVTALDDVGILFPNTSIWLQILATLPTSTAQDERMFSAVGRTAIRSTKTEVHLQVHWNNCATVDQVIDRFAATSEHRLAFNI